VNWRFPKPQVGCSIHAGGAIRLTAQPIANDELHGVHGSPHPGPPSEEISNRIIKTTDSVLSRIPNLAILQETTNKIAGLFFGPSHCVPTNKMRTAFKMLLDR
jgi:hypothetical protein